MYDFYIYLGIFAALMVILAFAFRERSIQIVYNKDGELAFKVYQIGVYGFLVRGFLDYPRQVRLRTYVDVVAYIDKHLNGWF